MRTSLLLALFLFLFMAPTASYAAEPADLEALSQGLSKAMDRFRQISTSRSEFEVVLHRDPMRSLVDGNGGIVSRSGFSEGLVLEGVIWSDEMKSVLVDDKFYKEGDTVGPYKITKIEREGMWTETAEGVKIFIPLYPENPSSPEV